MTNTRVTMHSGRQYLVKGDVETVRAKMWNGMVQVNGALYFAGWIQFEQVQGHDPAFLNPMWVEALETAP